MLLILIFALVVLRDVEGQFALAFPNSFFSAPAMPKKRGIRSGKQAKAKKVSKDASGCVIATGYELT